MGRLAIALLVWLSVGAAVVRAEDPYIFFTWNVTYGTISPLGVPQQGILINGQFPGPNINSTTNNNIVVNVYNLLDEPFLITCLMEVEDKLRNFVVGSLPTVIYIPDFITESEETQLLDNVYKAPQSKWKSLKNRRLQNWGGIVHEKGLLPQELPSWLTTITHRISEESGLFPSAINHVLINEYLPGQGIMPHQDGPAYFPVVAILSLGSPVVMDFSPHSSLRSSASDPTTTSEDNHRPFSVALMPRSLLIFKDEAYSAYLHGIQDTAVHQINGVVNEIDAPGRGSSSSSEEIAIEEGDNCELKCIQRTKTRISLTCRVVLKVHNKLFKF